MFKTTTDYGHEMTAPTPLLHTHETGETVLLLNFQHGNATHSKKVRPKHVPTVKFVIVVMYAPAVFQLHVLRDL